jgi:hypothetical protein
MMVTVSRIVVIAFAVVIVVLAAWGIYAPGRLLELVKGVMARKSGLYFAIIVRLVLGLTLIISAGDSQFPHVYRVLGWIAIIAAVGLAIIGRERMHRFVGWFDRISPVIIRVWLIFGIAFGGFLIYGLA